MNRNEIWDIGAWEGKQLLLNSTPNVYGFLVDLHLKSHEYFKSVPCIAGLNYNPKDGSKYCGQCIFSGEIRGLKPSKKDMLKVIEHRLICLISRNDTDKKYGSDVGKLMESKIVSEAKKANW